MIYITDSKANKSDSDRSVKSYSDRLRARIDSLGIDLDSLRISLTEENNNLRKLVSELRILNREARGYSDDIRARYHEKHITKWDSSLDYINQVLDNAEQVLTDVTENIDVNIGCISNCYENQSAICTTCYGATYSSSAGSCTVLDTTDKPTVCSYTNPCTSCYDVCHGCNTCQGDNCSGYSAYCESCYGATFSSCKDCQGNVSYCSDCYGGVYGTCTEGQQTECSNNYGKCDDSGEPAIPDSCGIKFEMYCGDKHSNCTADVRINCLILNHGCVGTFTECKLADNYVYCESNYDGGDEVCGSGYEEGVACQNMYGSEETICPNGFSKCSADDNMCVSDYQDSDANNCSKDYILVAQCESKTNQTCTTKFTSTQVDCSTTYSKNDHVKCVSNFTVGGGTGDNCKSNFYYDKSCSESGCKTSWSCNSYNLCNNGGQCTSCYGIAYGCTGCYDVAYCSKCNTTQTTCDTCVRGEYECTGCDTGLSETGDFCSWCNTAQSEDVCSSVHSVCSSGFDSCGDPTKCSSSFASTFCPSCYSVCEACVGVYCTYCHGSDGSCSGGDSPCGQNTCTSCNTCQVCYGFHCTSGCQACQSAW